MNKINGWYNIAKFTELQAQAGWGKDIRKGLMWGAGAGLIPATIGLMHPRTTEQPIVPEKQTPIVQKESLPPKIEPQSPPAVQQNVVPETQPQSEPGIDKILYVIKQMESSGGTNSVPRFEPAFLARYRNTELMKKLIETYGAREAASSYGPYQIMLLKAHELGFHYSPEELSDPVKNEEVAKKIVSNLVAKGLPVKDVFKRYNGGGKMADRYSQKAMKIYNAN